MRKYELTYLISDSVPEKDLNKVTGIVSGFISELGGKVDKEDIWGRRKLAYPIKKQEFATYVTLFFGLPAEKVIEFERDMHATTTILRHLLIVKEYGSEAITLTADEIAETGDIEDVVGGEKSFEAIEGETEDSRTLMAKREQEVTEGQSDGETERETAEEKITEVKSEKPKVKSVTESAEELESAESEIPEAEEVAEDKVEKTEKIVKKVKKEKTSDTPSLSHSETEKETKPKAEKVEKKAETKKEDESERLSKLNDQLDDILKDEL